MGQHLPDADAVLPSLGELRPEIGNAAVEVQGATVVEQLQAQGRHYILGALAPSITVAPGTTVVLKEGLFVGPKLQKQLETLHPELDLVADYGVLTLLSKPLFWLLDHAHSIVKNWGLAIIIVTFLLKLLFYPLSEKAGRSMARMRALAPRMKQLQELYKDDRTKLGQETMELYKREKVNPLAGCLPMLIQMPVFLALVDGAAYTQTELARIASVEQPTMANTLARMERDGLIERTPDPADRRSSLVSLNKLGRKRAAEAMEAALAVNEVAFARLSAAERKTFFDLLHRVIAVLDADGKA